MRNNKAVANSITKRIRLVLLTMVLSISIAAALVAMAAAMVTTDPNAFQASIAGLGTPTVINFEDIDASPVNNSTVGRAQFNGGFYAGQGITFSNPNGDPLYIAPGGLFWNATNSLSVSNFPFESGSDTNDDLVVTFNPPMIAAGFTFVDNGSQNPDEFVQFLDSNGAVIQQVGLPPNFSSFPAGGFPAGAARAFLGMVSVDRPIAKINIVEGANDGDDVAYDDFIFVPMGGCAPPPSGLVSWWPGDGNADDIKDGNPGMLMNGAMFMPGVVGQAFSFDGVDDYVEVPHDASLDIGTGFTFDAWIKADNAQQSDLWCIVDKAHRGPGIGWTCHGAENVFTPPGFPGNRATVPGEIFCSVGSGGTFTLVGTQTNVKDGQFHHIALVWTGAELQMYLDGVLKETNPLTGPVNNNTDPLRLGENVFHGADRPFRGLVDEVEFFSRGLTASEIQSIFAAGVAGKCKDADGDGVLDGQDACPNSIVTATVVIDGCDSEVPNTVLSGGCTIADKIAQCAANASNHGQFVSCVSHLTNELKKTGIITNQQKAAIQKCAAHANIP